MGQCISHTTLPAEGYMHGWSWGNRAYRDTYSTLIHNTSCVWCYRILDRETILQLSQFIYRNPPFQLWLAELTKWVPPVRACNSHTVNTTMVWVQGRHWWTVRGDYAESHRSTHLHIFLPMGFTLSTFTVDCTPYCHYHPGFPRVVSQLCGALSNFLNMYSPLQCQEVYQISEQHV